MDTNRFVKCIREMAEFLAEFSIKDEKNMLGDWRATKRELSDGSLQGLIYRKATEINLIYSKDPEKEVEMYVTFNRFQEPLLYEAIQNYCASKSVVLRPGDLVKQTIEFKVFLDFEIFVYRFLLSLTD